MAKPAKPKLLTSRGKSPLLKVGLSAALKSKSPLAAGQKRDYSKRKLPEQAFAIPGFGDTGMTGRS